MNTSPTNMNSLFEKLNDLKSIFKFTEKVVPIIQSLTEFMKEVVPLLENINTSIADSTSKIPQASNQIKNVTSATELATTEILDLVDEITGNLKKSETILNNVMVNWKQENQTLVQLRALVKDNEKAAKLLEEYVSENDYTNQLKDVIKILVKSNNDTYKITLSLQVQDITAQQLAAVNHLIQSVHAKLASLIDNIEHAELDDDIKIIKQELDEQAHYDPNASYLNSAGKQNEVDEIINLQGAKTSQEEIDKLFR
ncbi:MAG: protein phosphatase CheZ [Ignavibacteriales bacterium]|nr:protein phosphatase CheZ [Ignavibacteriales bacterium]